jgi:hypothetical protein
MLRYSRAKIAAVLLLVVAGFLYAAPSLLSPETRSALREATPGFLPSWLIPHQAIVLGLDLQGGSHVLLEVDSAAVLKTQVATLRDDMRRILRDEKVALAGGLAILPRGVSVRITDEAERKRVVPKFRELATPTGNGGVAYDVNNDGDIVGYYVGKDSEIVPCVWRKGVPLPLISEVTHVAPNIINNTGNVVASGTIVRNDAEGNAVYVSVGAIFTATGDVQLIERGLKTSIDLSDITDSGIAVGYLKSYENETPYEGAGIFEGSDFTPLPSGDSPFTKPTSIADDGTVFGFAIDTSTDTIGAVRWTRQGDRLRMNVGLGWPGDQVPVEAKVLRNGKPVANRRVTFQVDGKNAGTGVTDATGTARTTYQIPTTLSKGKQEFMGSLGGSNYVLKMVSVNKFPTRVNTMMATGKPGGQVSLRAALQNTKTGAWTGNQTIVFMLGGKEFARAKTDSRGIATHQYKLARSVKPGTYTLKARYHGNATHLPFERNLTLVVTAP